MKRRKRSWSSDDDESLIPVLEVTLRAAGYGSSPRPAPPKRSMLIERDSVDILVSDVDMPVLDGLELVSRVKKRFPWVVRILLTAHGTIDVAMAAINRGEVFRFVTKPWSRKDLAATLSERRAFEATRLHCALADVAAQNAARRVREAQGSRNAVPWNQDRHAHEGGVRVLDSARTLRHRRAGLGFRSNREHRSRLENPEQDPRSMSIGRKTVFVVDDDPDLLTLIGHLLGTMYDVRSSTDPVAALATLAKGPAPDLLLLDVMMPGMDGLTLAKKLELLPHLATVPLVFLTTRGGLQDVVAGINAGARHYVTKPFKAVDLLAKIDKVLR